MFKKLIAAHFFTTINWRMSGKTLLCLVFGWLLLRKGKYVRMIEKNLLEYLDSKSENEKRIISFYNARSALYHGLKMIGIKEGDEVIVQAYTCVSVPNSIIGLGAVPIYVDIDPNTLNIDPRLILSKISYRTRAVVVQHTFGNPADINAIRNICERQDLVLIEDCAHSLGAEYRGVKCGNFGDISIFSFGRDKVISTVNGGFLLINNPDLFALVDKVKNGLKPVPRKLLIKNLFYMIASWFAYKLYNFFSIGKAIIHYSRKFSLIPEILTESEKKCEDWTFDYAYPDALAFIGLMELARVDKYNKHRENIEKLYEFNLSENITIMRKQDGAIELRNVCLTEDAEVLMEFCKSKGVLLGDWYRRPIAPANVDYDKAMYEESSCPFAERLATMSVNLPNHMGISKKDAENVIDVVKNFVKY